MFYPSSTNVINRRVPPQKTKKLTDKNKKIPISDDVCCVGLSQEDLIRKFYGDNIRHTKVYGESYLRKLYGYDKLVDPGKENIKLVDLGKGNMIKSGGSKGEDPKRKENIIKSGGSKSKEPKPAVGDRLKGGFRQFLSNNGKTTHLVRFEGGVPGDKPVDFDCLSGKYLLICCFNLPMHKETSAALGCRSLIEAYQELSILGCPFELVVVANLRTDVVYDLKAAFYHFYSAFSCLAIPFSDFETRDYIHSYIRRSILNVQSSILVDPEGIILEAVNAFRHFSDYGSEWTPPFLPSTLDAINKQDEVLRSRLDPMYLDLAFISKLHPMYSHFAIDDDITVDEDRQQPLSLYLDILLCDPHLTLTTFHADDDELSSTTLLDLSHKYVGLYLFIDGDIMKDIKQAHDHCLANSQQLEIVLVPMLFYNEPESHFKQLRQALGSLKIKSWFLYHCPSVVRRRLWRIFGRGLDWPGEKFIIIPPGCESGEMCGREVLINFGVDQYPFTRTAILKQRLEYVRSLTPIFSSSLFNNCRMFQNGKDFKSKQLQGKNVLLYLSWTEHDHYSLMKKHYPEIKAMGWEVVLVLLDYKDRNWNQNFVFMDPSMAFCKKWPCFNLEKMPWPYTRLSAAAGASIKKLFFPGADKKTVYLFAVGKDGKIVSRDVERRLENHGVTESLFDDVLEADLGVVLARMPLFDGREY